MRQQAAFAQAAFTVERRPEKIRRTEQSFHQDLRPAVPNQAGGNPRRGRRVVFGDELKIRGRQPFGGNRVSGTGAKAGGPHYLREFVEPRAVTENTVRHGLVADG